MKKSKFKKQEITSITGMRNLAMIFFLVIAVIFSACKKSSTPVPTANTQFQSVVLVADTAGFNAGRIDQNLSNPWGVAINPAGIFYIAINHNGTSQVLDKDGAQVLTPINIPLGASPNGSSPTGAIYNATSDFVIPGKGVSSFIFSTEDGILSAWNQTTGASSVTVADRSSTGTVYKGLAMAADSGANFIYATDFHNAKIDVFNKSFALVTTKKFKDTSIPNGFAPFNIANIGGMLYVTYAKQLAPDNKDDQKGVGNGYVNVFNPGGVLVYRFASQGLLDSPWGIAKVSTSFGDLNGAILIGNFGDGHINAYDMNGSFIHQLKGTSDSDTLKIEGLWSIVFNNAAPGKLYFTAGPNEENHGTFGYIKSK